MTVPPAGGIRVPDTPQRLLRLLAVLAVSWQLLGDGAPRNLVNP
ncbi:hypothetical protein [Candidatus Poriferisodalis sp.]